MRTTRPSGAFHSKRNTLELVSQFLTAGGYTTTTLILHFEKKKMTEIVAALVNAGATLLKGTELFDCLLNRLVANRIILYLVFTQVNTSQFPSKSVFFCYFD